MYNPLQKKKKKLFFQSQICFGFKQTADKQAIIENPAKFALFADQIKKK